MLRFLFGSLFMLPLVALSALPFLIYDPATDALQINVNQSDARRQSVLPGNAPSGQAMLHAKWDCSAANYLEFNFLQPIPLPEFNTGEVALEVFIPEGAPIRKINFRLIDSQGETFQYMFPTAQLKPGLQTLLVQLNSVHKESWGAKKNGRVDFPARMLGVSVDFNRKEGQGELWIGKVAFTPGPLELGEMLVDLATTPVRIHLAGDRGQTAAVEEADGRQALRFNWDAARGKWMEFAFTPPLPPFAEFDSARFCVELLIPENFDGKTVNLRLSDKSGEVFQYPLPTKGLAPGWHLVSLRVEKSGAPARGIWSGDQNRKLDFPVRLAGFSVDYPAGSGEGTVAFGKVYLAR